MKVKATAEYEKRGLKDAVLDRIPKKGEVFEVSEERFEILSGKNPFNVRFIEKVEEPKVDKEEVKKVDAILNSKPNFKKRNR